METLQQLTQQYKAEFEDRYEGIRKRGIEQFQQAQDTIQQIQPEIQSKQQEIITIIQDTGPIAVGYTKPIIEVFAWTAIMIFVHNTVATISGIVLAPIVGLFVGSATAALLAYVAIPAFVVSASGPAGRAYKDDYSQGDAEIRFNLIAVAAVEGLLTGYLLSDRYLSAAQPFGIITPLAVAVVGAVAEQKIGNERIPIIGATIGAGAAIHLVAGLVTGQLSLAYIVIVAGYSAASVVAIQYVAKEQDFQSLYTTGKAYGIMFINYVAMLYVQAVVFGVFGGSKEAMSSAAAVSADEASPKVAAK